MRSVIQFLARALEARKGEFEFWIDNLMIGVVNEAGFVTVRVVGDKAPLFVLSAPDVLDGRPVADFVVRHAIEKLRAAGRVRRGVVEPRFAPRYQPAQGLVEYAILLAGMVLVVALFVATISSILGLDAVNSILAAI